MKHSSLLLMLALAGLLNWSCRGSGSTQFRDEWPQIVAQARNRVFEALPNLDAASRDIILTNDPRLLVVHIPLGNDYRFVWPISSNRTVELQAYGDYRRLDGRPVRILEATK